MHAPAVILRQVPSLSTRNRLIRTISAMSLCFIQLRKWSFKTTQFSTCENLRWPCASLGSLRFRCIFTPP